MGGRERDTHAVLTAEAHVKKEEALKLALLAEQIQSVNSWSRCEQSPFNSCVKWMQQMPRLLTQERS